MVYCKQTVCPACRGGVACEMGACATRGAEAETRIFLRSYGWECLPLRPEVHKPSACAKPTRIGGARERARPKDYINKEQEEWEGTVKRWKQKIWKQKT